MKSNTKFTPYLAIILIVFLAVIALIWLDYETTSWEQALSLGNIASGLLFYALPAILVVFFVFTKLHSRLNVGVSIAVSVLVGIPITFVLVVFALKLVSVMI